MFRQNLVAQDLDLSRVSIETHTPVVDEQAKNNSLGTNLRNLLKTIFSDPDLVARDSILSFDLHGKIHEAIPLSVHIREDDITERKSPEGSKKKTPLFVEFQFPNGEVARISPREEGVAVLSKEELTPVRFNLKDYSHTSFLRQTHEVLIKTHTGHSDRARVLVLPKNYDGPIFVCDIDDTLRPTENIKVAMGIQQKALPGAKELLDAIALKGIPIVYLSASPDKFHHHNERFLENFPPGVLVNRTEANARQLFSSNGTKAREQGQFKAKMLAEIIKTFPEAQLIGLGDDNFGDAMAYNNQGIEAFIRDARPGNNNFPANFHGTEIKDYSLEIREKILTSIDKAIARSASFGNAHVEIDSLNILKGKLDRFTGTRSLEGNKIEMLIDGENAYPKILNSIKEAKNTIYYETFNFVANDKVTKEITAALIEAKVRGVKVRMVLDSLGAEHFPLFRNPQIQELIKAGVDVQVFNPIENSWKLDLQRDHRKVMVVDGTQAFIGGMNTGDKYLGPAATPKRFHDLHARLSGPAVGETLSLFADSYRVASGGKGLPEEELNLLRAAVPAPNNEGGVGVRMVGHVPGQDKNIRAVYLTMINHADKHIYIQNPYPLARDIVDALTAAANRGVEVKYVIGRHNEFIDFATRAVIPLLMRAGVKVYVYPTPVHTKAISIDGLACAFGSSNFDEVALRRNREIIAVVEDRGFTQKLEQELFRHDFVYQKNSQVKTTLFKHETNDSWWKKVRRDIALVLWPETFR